MSRGKVSSGTPRILEWYRSPCRACRKNTAHFKTLEGGFCRRCHAEDLAKIQAEVSR